MRSNSGAGCVESIHVILHDIRMYISARRNSRASAAEWFAVRAATHVLYVYVYMWIMYIYIYIHIKYMYTIYTCIIYIYIYIYIYIIIQHSCVEKSLQSNIRASRGGRFSSWPGGQASWAEAWNPASPCIVWVDTMCHTVAYHVLYMPSVSYRVLYYYASYHILYCVTLYHTMVYYTLGGARKQPRRFLFVV